MYRHQHGQGGYDPSISFSPTALREQDRYFVGSGPLVLEQLGRLICGGDRPVRRVDVVNRLLRTVAHWKKEGKIAVAKTTDPLAWDLLDYADREDL